jgi:exosortase/archaeosortase family protein
MNVLTARMTEQVSLYLGMDAQRQLATLMHSGGFGYEIGLECTGIFPAVLLAAAILASPAPFSARLWGVLLGMFCMLILNLIRLVSLFHLGVQHPGIFSMAHSLIWPGVMIVLLICYFQRWRRSMHSHPESTPKTLEP